MAETCEYKMYFTNEIKRLGEVTIALQQSVLDVALTVEQLKASDKIRSAFFGAVGGFLSSAMAVLLLRTVWGFKI